MPRLIKYAFLWLALMLTGCASLRDVNSDVTVHSQWPANQLPGRYVFERLPSQQTQPNQQALLENAATPALARTGFTAVSEPSAAQYSVQLGARITALSSTSYDDPLGWRDGPASAIYWGLGRGIYFGGRIPVYAEPPTYEKEVTLLLRDRRTANILYEVKASVMGASPSIQTVLPALFSAALKDFPISTSQKRRVTVPLDQDKPSTK
jgi:hypothetical protein